MLQFGLIATIAAGFVIGYVLPQFTKEEMESGKKYFRWLEIGLFCAILIASVFVYHYLFLAIVLLLVGCPKRIVFMYLFLIIFLLLQPERIIASLGFLYGLPAGTLWRIQGE